MNCEYDTAILYESIYNFLLDRKASDLQIEAIGFKLYSDINKNRITKEEHLFALKELNKTEDINRPDPGVELDDTSCNSRLVDTEPDETSNMKKTEEGTKL